LHARERLDQRARRLPQPHALLSAQAQRLDDLGDRLRRSLGHRTELAAAQLARHAGALRPALLDVRLRRETERLAALRLRPEALVQRIAIARGKVEALDRLRRSLDPEAPLLRGYVLVTDAAGQVVKTRAKAVGEAELTLKFADGALAVTPRSARSRPAQISTQQQPKLL
jgi:exodeoxyribonuclease VII large subunit